MRGRNSYMTTHTHTAMHTQSSQPLVSTHPYANVPHTLPNLRVCHTPSHIIEGDNASSKCAHPSPPSSSSSSHFLRPSCSLSSAPIYLLSPALPVTQQLRPANPFWKETTEQKITSPPLSHAPSLPFVFSPGLLLTSLHHHHWGCLPPSTSSFTVPPDFRLHFHSLPVWIFMFFGYTLCFYTFCSGLPPSLFLLSWDDFSICQRPNSP